MRAAVSGDGTGAIGEALPRAGWPRTLELARRHGLVGILAHGLGAAGWDGVAPPVRAAVEDEARELAARNLALAAELLRVLDALAARGIPAIPYKGPALAVAAYGRLALRPFLDLDVIVPRDAVAAAGALLEAEGFRPVSPLPAGHEAAFLRSRYARAYRRPADGTLIELHWALAPRYFGMPFDFAGVHARMAALPLAGRTIRAPAPADLVVMLCAHGARHLWDSLEPVAALAAVVRRTPGLDWPELLARAAARGTERLLLVGVSLAAELGAIPLPAPVRARAAAHAPLPRMVTQLRRRLTASAGPRPGLLRTARLHLALRERLRDRIRYCVGGALSPGERDWHGGALPALRRPGRLLREHRARRKPEP